jgi:DNA-binding LacI/PurR family transcriptional regulator
MSGSLKHRAVSRQLAAEINSGKYRLGERLPSEAHLVKRFRVSRPTIGRALRDLQAEGLITRRAGSGTYVRNPRETATAPAGFAQLGLIVPSLRHTEIFESICGELASLARVHDYGLLWGGATQPPSPEAEMSIQEAETLCDQFIERRVVGVFFVPFEYRTDCAAANERITTKLHKAGIPVVLIDRDIGPFPERSGFDVVGVDNFAGGYTLATHLLKLGASRLAYVTLPRTAPTVNARIAGAQAAMLEHNVHIARDFVLTGDPTNEKFVRSFAVTRQLDAILCTSDRIAAQLLQTLVRLRIRVPEQIRLVGFDDMRVASLLTVPLTTMAQPCRDIAVTAFQAMRERLTDPTLPGRALLLTPRLVVRESCGAYVTKTT